MVVNMKTISMVFSAPHMIRLQPQKWMENTTLNERFCGVISGVVGDIKQQCQTIIPQMGCEISILFNAYVEESLAEFLPRQQYGFDKIYADSGGLQVITTGKEMNRELMETVYKTQSHADIAMAFDEIPVVTISNKTSLSNVSSRLYQPSRAAECAKHTANNIKHQCEFLADDDTQVLFITQGNNINDVVEWCETGKSIIPLDLWQRKIGGFALGSPCMGAGARESIENMLGYLKIIDQYPELNTGKRVHLLGYGSVERIMPSIELFTSHFVPDDSVLTFDSTSLSMTYMMGKWTTPTGQSIQVTTDEQFELVAREVLVFIEPHLKKHFGDYDNEELISHLVSTRLSISNTTRVDDQSEDGVFALAKCFVPCYILYQTISLWKGFKHKIDQDSLLIRQVNECGDIDKLFQWYYNNISKFNSKRVVRESYTPLNEFFT